MEKIKVLLVDDQLLFVESLRVVLEKMVKDIMVIGVAADGEKAIELAASFASRCDSNGCPHAGDKWG